MNFPYYFFQPYLFICFSFIFKYFHHSRLWHFLSFLLFSAFFATFTFIRLFYAHHRVIRFHIILHIISISAWIYIIFILLLHIYILNTFIDLIFFCSSLSFILLFLQWKSRFWLFLFRDFSSIFFRKEKAFSPISMSFHVN